MENRPISCIRCGDIFLANFDLISGKRKGIKSALVIQKETIGKSGLAILSAPLIPVSDAYPQGANIILEKGDGLNWRTLVCIEEVCVLDRRRFGRYIGHVGKDKRCSLSEVRCMNGPASMGHMPVTARNRLPGTGDLKIWNFVSVRSVLLHSSMHRGISSDRKTVSRYAQTPVRCARCARDSTILSQKGNGGKQMYNCRSHAIAVRVRW